MQDLCKVVSHITEALDNNSLALDSLAHVCHLAEGVIIQQLTNDKIAAKASCLRPAIYTALIQ